MYRQGDILLIKVEKNPLDNPVRTDILREGTITGHHHKIIKGKIFFQPIDENHIFAYVEAAKGCKLVHDEHGPIALPEGIYEVRRQREVRGYVED